MDKRKEWLEIRSKVVELAPAMQHSITLLDYDLEDAMVHAQDCDVKSIGFALLAAKLATSIRKDAEHLRAAGILDDDSYSKFTDELVRYSEGSLAEIIEKLTPCLCKAKGK